MLDPFRGIVVLSTAYRFAVLVFNRFRPLCFYSHRQGSGKGPQFFSSRLFHFGASSSVEIVPLHKSQRKTQIPSPESPRLSCLPVSENWASLMRAWTGILK